MGSVHSYTFKVERMGLTNESLISTLFAINNNILYMCRDNTQEYNQKVLQHTESTRVLLCSCLHLHRMMFSSEKLQFAHSTVLPTVNTCNVWLLLRL